MVATFVKVFTSVQAPVRAKVHVEGREVHKLRRMGEHQN
jgi:hypothetical protein